MENLALLFSFLTSWSAYLPQWLVAITAVVTAAAAITALTPSKSDDAFIAKVLAVLDWLSLNFGNAGTHNGTVMKAPPSVTGLYGSTPPKIKVE